MPTLTVQTNRMIILYLAASLWLLAPAFSSAQAPSPPSSTADLEWRVRELEEFIWRMQQEGRLTGGELAPVAISSQGESSVHESTDRATTSDKGTIEERTALSLMPGNPSDDVKSGAPPPNVAGWNEGFFLRSADKKYSLRFTGQIQADYRDFLDGADNTDIDTFLVRRARFGLEANMFEHYEFRLLPDFGSGQARVQDAYLNVHYWDAFQVEMGKFKEPFSYEQLIQDRFVPTLERSLIDQLTPARDEGVMIHGRKLFDDRLDYAIGVFNGVINGEQDTNNRKDLAARMVLRPFAPQEEWPLLRGLQVGISATTGIEQELASPRTLRTPATVPWFQFNAAVRADGLRNRWSPEIAYFYRGFGFAAQYFRQEQDFRPTAGSPLAVRVPFEGFYVLTTLLLTGEERTTYSQAIDPLRPFDPRCPGSIGAWELVARVSRLAVGEVAFVPGPARLVDPALFSSGATELTLGCNWYLNKWVRLQFNWEHAWFDDPVRLGPGPGGLLIDQDTLLTRFQVIF